MGSVPPLVKGSGTDFRTELSGVGLKGSLASGAVSGASVRLGADAWRALNVGARQRPRIAVCCVSAWSPSCQCVGPIWRLG